MKRRVIIVVISLLIILIIYSVFKRSTIAKPVQSATSVTVSPVFAKNTTFKLSAIGNVNAYSTVNVQSQVNGQLLKIGFKEGDYVKTGQNLFYIDPQSYQVALEQAKATLAGDQALYKDSELALARSKKLIKQAYISQQDYDQTLANAQSSAAKVKADQAAVDTAKLQLSYCTIQSPINGRTGNLLVYPGNLIQANTTASLVVINQMQPVYVNFALPEQHLTGLRKYLTNHKKIVIKAYTNNSTKPLASGYLSFINNTVDSTSGTIQLKAIFPNEPQKLWPGQFVTVELPIKDYVQAILIPTSAIQIGPDGSYVFVVEKNKAIIRQITPGPAIGQSTIVKKGLTSGEQVVTAGQLRLNNDSLVNVITPAK